MRPHRGWLKPGLVLGAAMLILIAALSGTGGGEAGIVSGRAQSGSPRGPEFANLSDHQFTGQGRIVGGSGKSWIISGLPVHVHGGTNIGEDLHVGDFVTLSGRIQQNKYWLADRVEKTSGESSFFTFNGPLEAVGTNEWQIGGLFLSVDGRTEMEDSAEVGDPVLVTFTIAEDGTWLATKIQVFDPTLVEPTATPTETPTPTSTTVPSRKAKSDGTQARGPESAGNKSSVTICHRPPGNPAKAGEKAVSGRALQEHLNHGDTLGPCP